MEKLLDVIPPGESKLSYLRMLSGNNYSNNSNNSNYSIQVTQNEEFISSSLFLIWMFVL